MASWLWGTQNRVRAGSRLCGGYDMAALAAAAALESTRGDGAWFSVGRACASCTILTEIARQRHIVSAQFGTVLGLCVPS